MGRKCIHEMEYTEDFEKVAAFEGRKGTLGSTTNDDRKQTLMKTEIWRISRRVRSH